MDSVCLVMASHTWMDGARPGRRDQNRRNQRTKEPGHKAAQELRTQETVEPMTQGIKVAEDSRNQMTKGNQGPYHLGNCGTSDLGN